METSKVRNYQVILVGERNEDKDDDTKSSIDYIRTSNPDEHTRKAFDGGPSDYIVCKLKEETPDTVIGGNRRYYNETLFENTDSAFFDDIKQRVEKEEYDIVEGSNKLKIKLRAPMPGCIRTFATLRNGIGFKFTPMTRQDGKLVPLRSNPKKDNGTYEEEYDKRPAVVKTTSQVFIPEADMEDSEAIILNEIEKLKKWAIGDIITQTVETKQEPVVTE